MKKIVVLGSIKDGYSVWEYDKSGGAKNLTPHPSSMAYPCDNYAKKYAKENSYEVLRKCEECGQFFTSPSKCVPYRCAQKKKRKHRWLITERGGAEKAEAAFEKMAKEEITKSAWLPSNGSEGELFLEEWCYTCLKCPVDPGAKNQCPHMEKSFTDEHNGQWFRAEDGSTFCKAYKSRAEYNRQRRQKADQRQQKLFG